MGFIKAFTGALGGTFADQWKDFYMPAPGVPATAAFFPAVAQGQNGERGENTKGNENIITNGSKIIVPEGTALITMQDGAITGMVAEPGGFIWASEDPNSKSMFAGDGVFSQLWTQTWDKFKFGGQPGAQQLAFYVNLKEIPGNKFGTQGPIYWDDAFFGTQVGAVTRGTYTLKIVDPMLFVKNLLPVKFQQPNAPVCDLGDMNNELQNTLFEQVVGSLASAFSVYTNDPSKGNRMSKIQGDSVGFAQAMSQTVETNYQWKSSYGLEIVKTAVMAVEYDADTLALMSDVKKADALSGARGNAFMQQSVARGVQAAGENGGGSGMAFMGMGMGAAAGMMGGMQQQPVQSSYQPAFNQPAPTQQAAAPQSEMATKLLEMKQLLDAGAITQEDYDAVKKQLLGL